MLTRNLFFIVVRFFYYFISFIYLSCKGVKLGSGAKVSLKAKIGSGVYIGNAIIGRGVAIGDNSYISSGYIFSGSIGSYCSIGYGAIIGPSEHDISAISMSPYHEYGGANRTFIVNEPIISNDVWIGANAIILRGVEIGAGAVVAAGAVVTRSIPAMEVWGGVPAKKIKDRVIDDKK